MREELEKLYANGVSAFGAGEFYAARDNFEIVAKLRCEDSTFDIRHHAQFYLGMMYLYKKVTPRISGNDEEEVRVKVASLYLHLAAQNEHVFAQYMYGTMVAAGSVRPELSVTESHEAAISFCGPFVLAARDAAMQSMPSADRVPSDSDRLLKAIKAALSPAVYDVKPEKFKEMNIIRDFSATEGLENYIPEGVIGKPVAIINAWGDCAYAAIAAGLAPDVFAKNENFRKHLKERFNLKIDTADDFINLVTGLFCFTKGRVDQDVMHNQALQYNTCRVECILANLRGTDQSSPRGGGKLKVKDGLSNDLHVVMIDSYTDKLFEKVVHPDGSNATLLLNNICSGPLVTLSLSGHVYQAFMALALRTFLTERVSPSSTDPAADPDVVDCVHTYESGETIQYGEWCVASSVVGEYQEPVVMARLGQEFGFTVECIVTQPGERCCRTYGGVGGESTATFATGAGGAAGGDMTTAPSVRPRLVVIRTGAGSDAHYSAIPQYENPYCLTLDVPEVTLVPSIYRAGPR